MEIQGKIRLVMEPQSGISARTGNPWMSQDVVIDYHWWPNQQEASQLVARIFGEEKVKKWNLQPGDEVSVRYHAEGREYNGRWYGENRIDGLTFVGNYAYKNGTDANASGMVAQAGEEKTAADAAGTEAEEKKTDDVPVGNTEEKDDDLPF